tara:strand:- start:3730 stop:5661 length:1932 start_codon:yes stop_codon:yes gene_type:complete
MDEQQIIQMVNSGMPVENIAAMTGLTGDQIVKITSGVPANAVGMNLGMGSGMGSGLDSGMLTNALNFSDNVDVEFEDVDFAQAEALMSVPELQSVETVLNSETEDDALKAVSALALGTSTLNKEDVSEGYKGISDLVDIGGYKAVEEFVRAIYTDDDNTESIPEWALPAATFGTILMNETGDWKQAILKARGKTASVMYDKNRADEKSKAELDLQIKKDALKIYTDSQPKAIDLTKLIGKVTTDSIDKYSKSGKYSDLVSIEEEKDVTSLLDKFTATSVGAYQASNDLEDLVRIDTKGGEDITTLDFLKEFTPASVAVYEEGGRDDPSVLVRKPNAAGKTNGLTVKDTLGLLDKYTAESVDIFMENKKFSELVLKDPAGWSPTVGSTTLAQQQSDLKLMETVDFREKTALLSEADRIKRLRQYSLLHAQTTQKINEKTLAGEILKQNIPLASFSVEAYAQELGLDPNNQEVGRILNIAKVQLPFAKPEDINKLSALTDLKTKVDLMGKILETTPGDVTGVKGYLFDTNAARIAADLIPGFNIPVGATVTSVFSNVAEVNLIEEILKEARFSNEDRVLVREFINGKSFKTLEEAKLRHTEVMTLLTRGLEAQEYYLENYQLPSGMQSDDTRINALRDFILNQKK